MRLRHIRFQQGPKCKWTDKKNSQTLTGPYTFSIYIFNNFYHEASQDERALTLVLIFVLKMLAYYIAE
jgi:hypothetical protein